tara:strand:+ start:185 stop:769 length:585 start_codon:yes stop_codon:yes gene_type:complete
MNKTFDFYFDFISPYSYLAYKKLNLINKERKIKINFKPMLLGGLHKLGGITAPAFNKLKLKNMKIDCELVAKKNNIEFYWNSKFPINSLYLMRGYLVINDQLKKIYFDNCFDDYWKNNIDLSKKENFEKILKKTDLIKRNFFDNIDNLKIKDELKKLTSDAFNKDIFGAPTFVVNNKIFWGQDRLGYALDEYYS